jgi:DUF1680 family protein
VLESHGQNRRWKWHYCPCCPTNIARFITSLGQYFYSTKADEVAIHLYGENAAELSVGNTFLRLTQKTEYPWDGDVRISLGLEQPKHLTLRLRIPGWCRDAKAFVNGVALMLDITRGYAAIEREWKDGDEVRLSFDMPVDRLYAHPAATEDNGRFALRRGPVIFCVEEADLGTEPQRLRLPSQSEIAASFDETLLGGATVLEGDALEADASDWRETLYRTEPPALKPTRFRAIPYHLWANREPGAMVVWLHEK